MIVHILFGQLSELIETYGKQTCSAIYLVRECLTLLYLVTDCLTLLWCVCVLTPGQEI
jgi:hypothetical protein